MTQQDKRIAKAAKKLKAARKVYEKACTRYFNVVNPTQTELDEMVEGLTQDRYDYVDALNWNEDLIDAVLLSRG